MINVINEAKKKIYNMEPSPSRISHAYASTESYNTYPDDYVPPFKYYTENSDS